jgi:hypothetical protein
MEYDDPAIQIRDLDLYASWADLHTKPTGAIIAFVRQFHEVNTRWGHWYEPVTESLITLSAEIQEELLRNHRAGRKPLSEIHVLIASALRILGLAHNISLVEAHLSPVPDHVFIKDEMFLDPEQLSPGPNPSIEISRHNPCTDSSAEADRPQLATLIQDLVRITQRLLLRARPWDLPILFCVLCLLRLIQSSITCFIPYIDMPHTADGRFDSVWGTLCQLYDAASKGHNPLVDTWDRSQYAALVGSHTLALTQFEALNGLWVEAGMFHKSTHS